MTMDDSQSTIRVSIVRRSARRDHRWNTEELASALGISVATLERLVRVGVIEPLDPAEGVFGGDVVMRLERMLRLHADVGVNFTGAAIILDLLEQLERVEDELERLRR